MLSYRSLLLMTYTLLEKMMKKIALLSLLALTSL